MQEVSTETSRAVVAKFFRALRAGNIDALRAAFAPDATWILRGGLPASGHGPARTQSWTDSSRIFGRLDPEVPQ